MVNIKINGLPYQVEEGMTILEAAKSVGINIPTLCYLKDINAIGACRICVVEVKGARTLVTACVYPVNEGMEISTNSQRVMDSRRRNLQLILSTHEKKCLSCVRSGNCELQGLAKEFGVEDCEAYAGEKPVFEIDNSAVQLYRDNNKCILCRRCVAACKKWQGVAVIGPNERGINTHIGSAFEMDLADVACVGCGQCINVCPTGALSEKSHTEQVWAAINDPEKVVIAQTAPAVRAALGEAFGLPIGTDVEGKMVAAMRRLGFDKCFDTNFGADLTIMEEAHELLERVKTGGTLPMITSCSPGWIKYCEHYFPDFIPNLSTCKSPQQMQSAMIKTWYAEKNGIDPKNIYVVGIMPCVAKKFEIGRDDQNASGSFDTDAVLTTREFADMIKRAGLDFTALPDEKFDDPMGVSTGAAVIFGATGGVMEAALRTAAEWITGEAGPVEFTDVRGMDGIKEASYTLNGMEIKVAIVSGLANAKKLLTQIQNGEKTYHFIEVMACPGGCINGGGQPLQPAVVRNFDDIKAKRAAALYSNDAAKELRKSHESPAVKAAYADYLTEPGSHLSHKLLHTSYVKRDKF